MKTKLLKILFLLAAFFMLPHFALAADKLLQPSDLIYAGAIKLPSANYGCTDSTKCGFGYGGYGLAYNPAGNGGAGSFFMAGHLWNNWVAEFAPPIGGFSNSSSLGSLGTARVLQNFTDITNGNFNYSGTSATDQGSLIGNAGQLGGLMVYNNKLIGQVYVQYDANAQSVRSHFTAGLDWTTGTGFKGLYSVGTKPSPVPQAGFLDVYMGAIPDNSTVGGFNWRTLLGGPVLTGGAAMSIISRTSSGPAAFVFDPTGLDSYSSPAISETNPIAANPLVYYPLSHQTLGSGDNNSQMTDGLPTKYIDGKIAFNLTTNIRGVVWPKGSKSIIFLGTQGVGYYCYGLGTNDQRKVWGIGGNTATNNFQCVDPTATFNPASGNCEGGTAVPSNPNPYCFNPPGSGNHGTNAYPYVYRAWMYNADDFLKVKNGVINQATGLAYQPWEILPYSVFDLNPPIQPAKMTMIDVNGVSSATAENVKAILSAAYDDSTQTIYLAESKGDAGARPLIIAYHVNVGDPNDVTAPAAPSGLTVQ